MCGGGDGSKMLWQPSVTPCVYPRNITMYLLQIAAGRCAPILVTVPRAVPDWFVDSAIIIKARHDNL